MALVVIIRYADKRERSFNICRSGKGLERDLLWAFIGPFTKGKL